jgi:L-seryl-tRNA(Ser) seleniumtransferase
MDARGWGAMNNLRSIPSVEKLLQISEAADLILEFGRALTLDAIHHELNELRRDAGSGQPILAETTILDRTREILETWTAPTLEPVINATGVILHTNLGRAPLSEAALENVKKVIQGYCTLEFDLTSGKRGTRSVHAENLLRRITGAEAALVVNNNAGAVLLALSALARRKNVIISRSQLVEIGGGFRVPDVMRQSGARLVEVGTTNRVHVKDYEEALLANHGLLLCAHHSNFRIIGFTSEPELKDLAELAHKFETFLIDDLGSGALLDTAAFGIRHEPTVQESLQSGADLVCFSGDKLLGGPQAGILVGKANLISKIKQHPLMRALRADKLCYAALTATLQSYLKGEAEREIPIWQMIAATPQEMQRRAMNWQNELGIGEVIPAQSTIGGGSLPEETLPTYVLSITGKRITRLLNHLRMGKPAVIARIENDRLILDPRTVLPWQEASMMAGLKMALNEESIIK